MESEVGLYLGKYWSDRHSLLGNQGKVPSYRLDTLIEAPLADGANKISVSGAKDLLLK